MILVELAVPVVEVLCKQWCDGHRQSCPNTGALPGYVGALPPRVDGHPGAPTLAMPPTWLPATLNAARAHA